MIGTSKLLIRNRGYNKTVEGVYAIRVAARILEMHPQTLRKYERIGLVMPSRTVGMLRLYSEEDIARFRNSASPAQSPSLYPTMDLIRRAS